MVSLTLLLVLAGGPREAWDFEGGRASVFARGTTRDAVSEVALRQLGLKLEGALVLAVSAHPNTVGGVTLRLEDPANPGAGCDLYAQRDDAGGLGFVDSRCSFPAFSGRLRTSATCRRISGTARKLEDGAVALEARAGDCTAQPLGLPLSVSGTLSPR
jgi:hypothetical protein